MRTACKIFLLLGISLHSRSVYCREANAQMRGAFQGSDRVNYDDCVDESCLAGSEDLRQLKESIVPPPLYTKKPVYSTKRPVYTSKKPTYAPVYTSKKSAYSPVYTSKKPAYSPVYTSKKPTYAPVYTSKKSSYAPVYTSKKPVYARFLKRFAPQYISPNYYSTYQPKTHSSAYPSKKYSSKVYGGRRLQKGYVPMTTYRPTKLPYDIPQPTKKFYIPRSTKKSAPYIPRSTKKSYIQQQSKPTTGKFYMPATKNYSSNYHRKLQYYLWDD